MADGRDTTWDRFRDTAKRHLAQRPDGTIDRSPWRYSLMNRGHDSAKSRQGPPAAAEPPRVP